MRRTGFVAALAMAAMVLVPTAARAAADEPQGQPVDARAAAHATAASTQSSWFSGTVAAGKTKSFVWNNANPQYAFVVGFAPVGATTTQGCAFEVDRSWYVQQSDGDRQFRFDIKNVGSLACGTEILISGVKDQVGPWTTGGVDAGGYYTGRWNNANPLTTSYIVGVAPSGATHSADCRFEIVRTWYVQQPTGEREFWFTAKNVGTIACTAEVLLAGEASKALPNTGDLAPNQSLTRRWNNANPLDHQYVVGLSPKGDSFGVACQMEVTRTWYREVINPPAEREFSYTVKNVGAMPCSADVLLASIAA
jgi:hypothetical protein